MDRRTLERTQVALVLCINIGREVLDILVTDLCKADAFLLGQLLDESHLLSGEVALGSFVVGFHPLELALGQPMVVDIDVFPKPV